jgi:hypothetical protein
MARIKQRNSDLLNFQSQYVSLNPLKTTVQEDQEIGGILIPKGSTFSSSLKLFNEKNPYSSSVIKTPEAEPESDAAQGTVLEPTVKAALDKHLKPNTNN